MSGRSVAACQGKSSFTKWSDARRRADRMERREETRVNVFRCADCGQYHLGSSNEVYRQRIAHFKHMKQMIEMEEMEP
jgi:Zn ribbon nucleic-acid-binding protein